MNRIAIGTRFWGKDHTKDFPRINSFVEAAKEIGDVFVAVNSVEDKIDTLNLFPDVAFEVTPWGKFVQPLNAIVLKAIAHGNGHLLLASAEFPPQKEHVEALMAHMDDTTLVVGAAFGEHEFLESNDLIDGNGSNIPWNTYAIWNLRYLGRLGFPLVGDAPFNTELAGVEELATISVYQHLYLNADTKLVRVAGLGGEWNMDGWDDERRAKHQKKIQSKKDRPKAQLEWAELPTPCVEHFN